MITERNTTQSIELIIPAKEQIKDMFLIGTNN